MAECPGSRPFVVICYLVASTALLGSPHVMPEKWAERDEATLSRVAGGIPWT